MPQQPIHHNHNKKPFLWKCYGYKHDEDFYENIKIYLNKINSQTSDSIIDEDIFFPNAARPSARIQIAYEKRNNEITIRYYSIEAYRETAEKLIPNFKTKILQGEIETRMPAQYANQLGISTKQLLQGNKIHFKNSPVEIQFRRDVREWQATIDSSKLTDTLEIKRITAIERLLRSTIIGGLNIRSSKHANWQPASANKIPAAAYFSHGGRQKDIFDSEQAAIQYLAYIFQVDKPDSYQTLVDLLTELTSFKVDNPAAAKKNQNLLYVRSAGTHNVRELKFHQVQTGTTGYIKSTKEFKSHTEGAKSFLNMLANKASGRKKLSWHFGMSVPIGGIGNIAPDGSIIDSDERSGSLYCKITFHENGTVSLLKGFEPIGPVYYKNVFGEQHSLAGKSGKFSPTGGLKFPREKKHKTVTASVWDNFEQKFGTKPPAKYDCMMMQLSTEKLQTITTYSEQNKVTTSELLGIPVHAENQNLPYGVSINLLEIPASFTYQQWDKYRRYKPSSEIDIKLENALVNYCSFKNKAGNCNLLHKTHDTGIITLDDAHDIRNLYTDHYPNLMHVLKKAISQTINWLLKKPNHKYANRVKVLLKRLLVDQINVTYNYYQIFYQQFNSATVNNTTTIHDRLVLLQNLQDDLNTYLFNARSITNILQQHTKPIEQLISQHLREIHIKITDLPKTISNQSLNSNENVNTDAILKGNSLNAIRTLPFTIEMLAKHEPAVKIIERLVTSLATCGLRAKPKSREPLAHYINNMPITMNFSESQEQINFLNFLLAGFDKHSQSQPWVKKLKMVIDTLSKPAVANTTVTFNRETSKPKKKFSLKGWLNKLINRFKTKRGYEKLVDDEVSCNLPITLPIKFYCNMHQQIATLHLTIKESNQIQFSFDFPNTVHNESTNPQDKQIWIDANEIEKLHKGIYHYTADMLAKEPINAAQQNKLAAPNTLFAPTTSEKQRTTVVPTTIREQASPTPSSQVYGNG